MVGVSRTHHAGGVVSEVRRQLSVYGRSSFVQQVMSGRPVAGWWPPDAGGGPQLTPAGIRAGVVGHVRRDPPSGGNWHARYGNGRVDAAAAVRSVFRPPILAMPTLASAQSAATENGAPYASTIGGLLSSLAGSAASGKVRVRLEVEIEP